MHGQAGMAVEHAGIDQPDRRHDQREFAADAARGVVGVELLRVVEFERRMHEHEHAELLGLAPERFDRRIVDPFAVEFRADGHALEAELVAATRQLLERRGAAERMRVRGADEAARVVALGLFGLVVDKARGVEIGAHAGRAREPRGVDAGQIHHRDVFVEIVEQRMYRVARRSQRVVIEHQAVARVVLDQFARREMVLEVDNHRASSAIAALS